MRLDSFLVADGIIKSRERAKEAVKNNFVRVNGTIVSRPSFEVSDDDSVEFTGEQLKYVGRGGLKLEHAINAFGIDVSGKICMDIGASTGCFTDCMLQNGAEYVYAVDVGHDQLALSLANDKRVKNLERTNIKELSVSDIDDVIEFISADVSFISLRQVLPKISELLSENGEVVVLIKPQFEAGKKDVGKNGIVKDKRVHERVISSIMVYCSTCGLFVNATEPSPITGGDGNIEYVALLSKKDKGISIDINNVVEAAFSALKK